MIGSSEKNSIFENNINLAVEIIGKVIVLLIMLKQLIGYLEKYINVSFGFRTKYFSCI